MGANRPGRSVELVENSRLHLAFSLSRSARRSSRCSSTTDKESAFISVHPRLRSLCPLGILASTLASATGRPWKNGKSRTMSSTSPFIRSLLQEIRASSRRLLRFERGSCEPASINCSVASSPLRHIEHSADRLQRIPFKPVVHVNVRLPAWLAAFSFDN